MWHLKTTTLPVVVVALDIVAQTAPNYVSQIPGAPSINRTSKNNTHGHRTYPAKGTINVIYIYIYTYTYIYMYI